MDKVDHGLYFLAYPQILGRRKRSRRITACLFTTVTHMVLDTTAIVIWFTRKLSTFELRLPLAKRLDSNVAS